MKLKPFVFIALFFISRLFAGCQDDSSNNSHSGIDGKMVKYSACGGFKSARLVNRIPDTLSCVEYAYHATSRILNITHFNTGFNCCPENLDCRISLNRDTIVIEEFEKAALCRCNCLYDMEMEVTGVTAKKYFIRLVEPYAGTMPKIVFAVNLAQISNGSFCVTRKNYPWSN